jgi:hypothetical protein
MNANPADTRFPHLDLGDLIAEASGQAMGDRALEHLAGCEHCQLEKSRWHLVADGVRGLAAAAPETARPASETAAPASETARLAPETVRPASETAPPAPRRRSRRRAPSRPGRRVRLAGSAAAGLVLLGGAVYGVAESHLVHVSLNGTRTPTETALTAVTGCSQLLQADGTLERVNGSSLDIATASGRPLTVTTTASTFVGESGALLSDITDGASVTVAGPSSAGTVTALMVGIGNPGQRHPQTPPADVVVKGTVADASAAGFTVVTPGGTRVPVTTTSDTVVSVDNPSLGQLPLGATAYALGHAGPGGTLSAQAVAVIVQLPQGGPQLHARVSVHVKDCSPASVNHAIMTLADGR